VFLGGVMREWVQGSGFKGEELVGWGCVGVRDFLRLGGDTV
jgi:hypothetical protein